MSGSSFLNGINSGFHLPFEFPSEDNFKALVIQNIETSLKEL